MIVSVKNRKNEVRDLLEIISECNSEDFYVTHENKRLFIKDRKALKHLLKSSYNAFYEESVTRKGLILVWKSFGGEKARDYVKVVSSTPEVCRDLLTALLWTHNKPLFVKLKKESNLIRVFRQKGFRFAGGRGTEVLLSRMPFSRER